MFPQSFPRNSNEVANVITNRKRTMAQRIDTVREQYTKTQQNLQQLMAKVDSYHHVKINMLTQQKEYYAYLQTLDYIALCLEEFSIWCRNFEAKPFEETPQMNNSTDHSSSLLSIPPPQIMSPVASPGPSHDHPSVAPVPTSSAPMNQLSQTNLSITSPPFISCQMSNAHGMSNSQHSLSIQSIPNAQSISYLPQAHLQPPLNATPPQMMTNYPNVPSYLNPNQRPSNLNSPSMQHLPNAQLFQHNQNPAHTAMQDAHSIPQQLCSNGLPLNDMNQCGPNVTNPFVSNGQNVPNVPAPNAPNRQGSGSMHPCDPNLPNSTHMTSVQQMPSLAVRQESSGVLVPVSTPDNSTKDLKKPSPKLAKKRPSQKKCNEMLIDFSSASSLSEDSPKQASASAPRRPQARACEPAGVTKKKMDQLEAKVVQLKVEEDDPTVVSLPAQKMLDVTAQHDCVVSHVHSLSRFYVLTDPFNQCGFVLSRLTEDMEKYYNANAVDIRPILDKMSYCAVKQNDEWFRCFISNVTSDDSLEVYFLDYGGVEVVPLDSVQPLVPRFCVEAPFARCCYLYGVEPLGGGEWSEEARQVLADLHCCTMLKIRIEDDSSELLGVTLVQPSGDSVNGELVRRGLAVNTATSAPADHASHTSLPSVSYSDNATGSTNADPWDISDCPEYTDALMAVQGYSNRDEAEICKHFKGPPHTTCFKGRNCTKKHILMHPDGWTLDREEVICDLPVLPLPAEGMQLWVFVSNVHTYKQIHVLFCETNKDGSLKSGVPAERARLIERMNSPSVAQSLSPADRLPAVGEFVTARFEDNLLYRAQVIGIDDENNRVHVLYVDFGNRCWQSLRRVYRLDPEFVSTPVQATRACLATLDVKTCASLQDPIALVRKAILEKPLRATVLSHMRDSVVNLELEDSEGFSVAEMLATQHPAIFALRPAVKSKPSANKGPIVVPG